ncbi:unnamed protein product [Toxocara canis]|uniref:Uncharacterized protein n=1 Tax=Toxocara canis TaxID=6265 RepID=A0A183U7Z5_TOXCA|nr:unnamed protein product [Toxocara canis]
MRGRGGWRRGGGPMFHGPAPYPPPPGPVYACWPAPFDLTLCEASFPRAKELDDSDLAQVCSSYFYAALLI